MSQRNKEVMLIILRMIGPQDIDT